ncbi:glycosyltransferase family 4 protein [Paenibacillus monticola]|uniref:Glycosyltransferase n=1 Tax=Paenibacillus monticola TaxID=2666075 RepID=A0A7X2L2G2_9BACL|nr:glycosyltransferase family 4 protein [Paenibacillus monticola]MRN54369.1 glycosyltransferase [Paenibacillus monticola]
MNIAIVSPSPKPFAVGGIEKLMLGLYYNIDKLTDHRVELFKIPVEENDFWSLINSYESFYRLNLDHFDMIISFKYPAWMVKHKNHVIYMAHHLRGLFDTYHFMNMPETISNTKYAIVNEVIEYTKQPSNIDKDLDSFFALLKQLYKEKNSLPDSIFSFPGPFIRTIIHFLDKWALSPQKITRFASISNTVKERIDYFPLNANVDVIYPPTSLENLETGAYEYFLIVGRLDTAKRTDIVIEAMKQVNNPKAKLLVAGTGPEEYRLKSLAGDDSRITFLGYINNEKLIALYRDALAVIYVPYDEDYGLVTIEAMHCKKPVITCIDSGGTTEFVKHEITGLIAQNNAKSLAQQIECLIDNVPFAMEMGENAANFVSGISWANTINKILSIDNIKREMTIPVRIKKKITILSTYPVFPKKHGGQLRIFNLYSNLQDDFDITIVSVNDQGQYYKKEYGSLIEISIPKSQKHQEKEWAIEKEVGIPITDIAMQELSFHSPEYHAIAKEYIEKSDILIAAQPYLFHLFNEHIGSKTIIYDSQNVEYELKKSMLPPNKMTSKLIQKLYEIEKNACLNSDLILACSKEDILKFTQVYDGIDEGKFMLTPNGVDLKVNQYVSPELREIKKTELGLTDQKIIVFIGSWHKPNLEAVEEILKMAPDLPSCKFIIMGGQCEAFKSVTPPSNVAFAGIVSEEMKQLIYSVADIAINPMVNGSGTNLKIAEYMANGVPVISTEVGARGYDFQKTHLVIAELVDFSKTIEGLMLNKDRKSNFSEKAYEYIRINYSWSEISEKLKKIITD